MVDCSGSAPARHRLGTGANSCWLWPGRVSPAMLLACLCSCLALAPISLVQVVQS
ncbi:hypothetical protein BDV10DRAFT_179626, partial [Aspergillus recurvatus]